MPHGLSPREQQVTLVCQGMTNRQIASALELSESTARHYLEAAMRKAGVDNRTSLALWWTDPSNGRHDRATHPRTDGPIADGPGMLDASGA